MQNLESKIDQMRLEDPKLAGLQQVGLAQYQSLGLPLRRDNEWKYTNVRRAFEEDYSVTPSLTDLPKDEFAKVRSEIESYLHPEDISIVFLDGTVSEELSHLHETDLDDASGPLEIHRIKGASSALSGVIAEEIKSGRSVHTNGVAALNLAMLNQGLLIRAEKKTIATRPIHLVFFATQPQQATFPRVLIQVEREASLAVAETHLGMGQHLSNAAFDISVGDNAKLNHYRYQNLDNGSYQLNHTSTELAANANYHYFAFEAGSKLARNAVHVSLNAPGADASFAGVAIADDRQHLDTFVTVDHRVPHCTSSQLFKTILKGDSRSVFSGTIHVRQDAQKTSASQSSKALLMSDQAEADMLPQLLIDADDVKCSHGTAIGRLRDEELFYLKTRGLSQQEAESILSRAFAEEPVVTMSSHQHQTFFKEALARKIAREGSNDVN